MSRRPPYEPPPPLPPMSALTGNRIVVGLGFAIVFIGLFSMIGEKLTHLRLAEALEIPVFVSTPLGVGALLFVPLAVRVSRKQGWAQLAAALVYWSLWVYWSFV